MTHLSHKTQVNSMIFYIADEDWCGSNPCKNSATCVDDGNDYSCVCAPGYTSKNCESGKSELCIPLGGMSIYK